MASPYVVPAEKVEFYRMNGWVVLEDVISPAEILRIKGIADDMISGKIDCRGNRADLGGHAERVDLTVENIIQLAWPTDLTSALDENELIVASRTISDQLYASPAGTWALDMNQFLVKRAKTLTDTPLHQDQSYYIPLADPRACNIWCALVDVTEDMGCLWFETSPLETPLTLRVHRPAGRGNGALEYGNGPDLTKMTQTPLKAGSITVHSHMTPHVSFYREPTYRLARLPIYRVTHYFCTNIHPTTTYPPITVRKGKFDRCHSLRLCCTNPPGCERSRGEVARL